MPRRVVGRRGIVPPAAGWRTVAARAAAALLVTGATSLPATAHADAITDLQKRYQVSVAQAQQALSGLVQRRQQQQAVVDQLRGVTGGYAADLRAVDQQLMATVNALQAAEASLAQTDEDIRALEAKIAEKQEAVDQRAAAYATRLRGLYKFTRTSPLEELLGAHSFSEALQRLTMMQAVARVDNRLLGQLRSEQQALLAARAELDKKQAEATALRDQIEQQRQVLEGQRAQQAALVAKAQSEQRQAEQTLTEFDQQQRTQAAEIVQLQGQYQSELAELERQRQEELRRLEEQRRAQATATAQAQAAAIARATAAAQATAMARAQPAAGKGAPAATSGSARRAGTPIPLPTVAPLPGSVKTGALAPSSAGLIWPVVNPVVTTEFGESTFAESFHRGIDLAQHLYTPVLAAADGIVLQSGLAVPGKPSQSYGMRVVIGHSPSLATLYAHLDDAKSPPVVKAGDRVKRGQIIGYIGLTGITSGPHLHFEVQVGGEAKNPRNYLPK